MDRNTMFKIITVGLPSTPTVSRSSYYSIFIIPLDSIPYSYHTYSDKYHSTYKYDTNTMASVELRDRLQSLLLDTPSISSSASRPLVQVIRSDDGKAVKRGLSSSRSDADLKSSFDFDDVGDYCDDADDADIGDDDPPPIFSADRKIDTKSETASSHNHSISVVDHIPGAPSLAEQMLADAALANEERQKQQTREKLTAKRSTFGVKRGFLNSTSSKTNRKEKSATQNTSKHKPEAEESKADAEHSGNGKQVSTGTEIRGVGTFPLSYFIDRFC
jgi:hypothetical protein